MPCGVEGSAELSLHTSTEPWRGWEKSFPKVSRAVRHRSCLELRKTSSKRSCSRNVGTCSPVGSGLRRHHFLVRQHGGREESNSHRREAEDEVPNRRGLHRCRSRHDQRRDLGGSGAKVELHSRGADEKFDGSQAGGGACGTLRRRASHQRRFQRSLPA